MTEPKRLTPDELAFALSEVERLEQVYAGRYRGRIRAHIAALEAELNLKDAVIERAEDVWIASEPKTEDGVDYRMAESCWFDLLVEALAEYKKEQA